VSAGPLARRGRAEIAIRAALDFAETGRAQMAEDVSVWGSEDECAEWLGDVIAAGARLLLLNPGFDEMEHLERVASALAPRL